MPQIGLNIYTLIHTYQREGKYIKWRKFLSKIGYFSRKNVRKVRLTNSIISLLTKYF